MTIDEQWRQAVERFREQVTAPLWERIAKLVEIMNDPEEKLP